MAFFVQMSNEARDGKHIPRFKERRLSLGESLAGGMVPILALLLETVGAVFFALWAFNRMDVAG